MYHFIQAVLFCYAALFPVLNPLGGAVIYLSLTQGIDAKTYKRLALRVAFNTFILLIVVLFTGTWILRLFGITVPIVQIGGGLVVAYIGWTMLQNPSDITDETPQHYDEKKIKKMAFFPLTMPITAGPGAITVTLAVAAHEMSADSIVITLWGHLGAVVGILLSAFTVYLCYRYAEPLAKKLGETGQQVIMRLSAFINLCIGLEILWRGIVGLGITA